MESTLKTSSHRPTVDLSSNPEVIKKNKKEIKELKGLAENGEIILLFEDETVLWAME